MLNRMCKSKQEVQKAKATTKSNPKRDTQSPKIDADKSKASKGTKNNSFKTHKNSIVIKRNQNLSKKKINNTKILVVQTYTSCSSFLACCLSKIVVFVQALVLLSYAKISQLQVKQQNQELEDKELIAIKLFAFAATVVSYLHLRDGVSHWQFVNHHQGEIKESCLTWLLSHVYNIYNLVVLSYFVSHDLDKNFSAALFELVQQSIGFRSLGKWIKALSRI